MRRLFLTILLILAFSSLAGSLMLLLIGLIGMQAPEQAAFFINFGGILVFMASIFVMRSLQDSFTQREIRKQPWAIALRGAPSWVLKALKFWGWCASIAYLAFLLLPKSRRDAAFLPFVAPLYVSVFSALSAAIMYSALHIPNELKCPNGHPITPLQKFCSECGLPTAQPPINA